MQNDWWMVRWAHGPSPDHGGVRWMSGQAAGSAAAGRSSPACCAPRGAGRWGGPGCSPGPPRRRRPPRTPRSPLRRRWPGGAVWPGWPVRPQRRGWRLPQRIAEVSGPATIQQFDAHFAFCLFPPTILRPLKTPLISRDLVGTQFLGTWVPKIVGISHQKKSVC